MADESPEHPGETYVNHVNEILRFVDAGRSHWVASITRLA